jgi:putative transposase
MPSRWMRDAVAVPSVFGHGLGSARSERLRPFVRTVRNECLDWLLILGRRHLEPVLRIYVQQYKRERPHSGLALYSARTARDQAIAGGDVHRRDRIDGLVHEYYRAAA